MYNDEPIYIDDITSISGYSGKIYCVRFDKEIITVRFYDRNDRQITINRNTKEFIECSISPYTNNKAIVYLCAKADTIIMAYRTSLISANQIKSYYEAYNTYLSTTVFFEEEREEEKRIKTNEDMKKSIINIDEMTGFEFEDFIGYLFGKMGYKVVVTQKSNDQGIDIIAQDNFAKIGIQAKCYSSTVGNKAIQEAVAGKSYYKCDKVLVITNNYFTKSAIQLAQCNGVGLIDKEELSYMMDKYS